MKNWIILASVIIILSFLVCVLLEDNRFEVVATKVISIIFSIVLVIPVVSYFFHDFKIPDFSSENYSIDVKYVSSIDSVKYNLLRDIILSKLKNVVKYDLDVYFEMMDDYEYRIHIFGRDEVNLDKDVIISSIQDVINIDSEKIIFDEN